LKPQEFNFSVLNIAKNLSYKKEKSRMKFATVTAVILAHCILLTEGTRFRNFNFNGTYYEKLSVVGAGLATFLAKLIRFEQISLDLGEIWAK